MTENNNEISYLHERVINFPIHLHMQYMKNIKLGVRKQLANYLMKYMDDISSVILTFSKLKFQTDTANLYQLQPYIHFDVQAKCVCFTPNKGDIYKAKISKIGADHIILLYLGAFIVTIPKSMIPKTYSYDYKNELWLDQDYNEIKVSSELYFSLIGWKNSRGYFTMLGSLKEDNTGLDQVYKTNTNGIKSNGTSNRIILDDDDNNKVLEQEEEILTIEQEVDIQQQEEIIDDDDDDKKKRKKKKKK